jgi:hypothetical protein
VSDCGLAAPGAACAIEPQDKAATAAVNDKPTRVIRFIAFLPMAL